MQCTIKSNYTTHMYLFQKWLRFEVANTLQSLHQPNVIISLTFTHWTLMVMFFLMILKKMSNAVKEVFISSNHSPFSPLYLLISYLLSVNTGGHFVSFVEGNANICFLPPISFLTKVKRIESLTLKEKWKSLHYL